MSSLDEASYKFVTQFNAFYYIMKQSLNFTPNYISYENPRTQESKELLDSDDCIGGGKYCAPDPDSDGPLTGRDSILEDIRQICIH